MFNKFTKTSIFAISIIMASSGNALAEDDGIDISVTLTAATEYVWRGVSQSNQNPAIFGAVNASFGNGFYAGVGAENVDFGAGVPIDTEYDMWAGWGGKLSDLDVGFTAIRYGYVNAPSGSDLDTYDFKGAVGRSFDKVNLGVNVFYTPDYFGVEEPAVYYEAVAGYKFNDKWSVDGNLAKQTISNSNADYATWSIGTSYAVTDNVTLDLRYLDTDVSSGGKTFNDHVVLSFKVGL